jgi:hypothetical protein
MALSSEEIEQIVNALQGLKKGFEETEDVVLSASNLVKKFGKDFKEIQPTTKAFKDILSGTKTEIENMHVAAKKFDAAIKKAADAGDTLEEGLRSEAKAHTLNSMALSNAKSAAGNFAIGLGGVAKTMLSGATEFVKGLQGTAEGTELVTQASIAAAEATGKFATSIGSVMETVGTIAMLLGPGKIVKLIGAGLTGLGIGLEVAGPALTELATAGIKILGTEVEKTKKSFREITSTGAEFAGGMTEIRKTAFIAGLDIAQLSQAVKANTENLIGMGLGIAESTKRFAKISAEIRGGKLGIQLSNLGLTIEDQNEMIMLSSSMLNASGKLRNMNEKEAAAAVVALTKDLKVLQNITGEDAKKKLAQARADALEADILAEAREYGGEEGVKKVQALLLQTPDMARTAMLEAISTRGEAIVDPASAMLIAQFPILGKAIQNSISDLQDNQVTAAQITERTQDRFEAVKVDAYNNPEQMRYLARANRLSPGGGPPGFADMVSKFSQFTTAGATTGLGVAKQTRDTTNQAADTPDSLTRRMSETDAQIQEMKAKFGDEMTGLITKYVNTTGYAADALAEFTTATENATIALGGEVKAKGDSKSYQPPGGSVEDYNKSQGYPSMRQAKPVNAKDEISKLYDKYLAPTAEQKARRGFAQGGISTGPLSGYSEVLHGTEAVVPLPDNRSIPVTLTNSQSNSGTMDTKEMVSAISQQSGLLSQILIAMEKNNQLTSGILQTSY